MRKRRNWLPLLAVLVMAVLAMTTGAFAAGEEAAEYVSPFHATAWSLLPPVIAIGLALIVSLYRARRTASTQDLHTLKD